MIKSTFAKIALSSIKPDTPLESQITSFECDLVEEWYDENNNFIRAIEKRIKLRNQWVHIDALKIFDKLRAHMALICEIPSAELSVDEWEDPLTELQPERLADGIFVKSVNLIGGGDSLKVSLAGFKLLSNENNLDLKSPAIHLDEGEYPFAEQLTSLISELEAEARQAIYQQKGVGQLNLFDSGEPGESVPKKGGRKKNLADELMDGLGEGTSIEISHRGKTVSIK